MIAPTTSLKTLSVRVCDKHAAILSRMAFEANQVWNAANAETAEWCSIPVPGVGWIRNNISAFDLQKQLKGIKQERGFIIHSTTVQEVVAIVVGNVSSSALAKTTMAKSVLDAGWFMLKTQLKYKAIARSVVFEEVDEAYTTQAWSCCGSLSASSPKGRAGLGIREWMCAECGTLHDRDVNAARNILAAGHSRLAGGILVL